MRGKVPLYFLCVCVCYQLKSRRLLPATLHASVMAAAAARHPALTAAEAALVATLALLIAVNQVSMSSMTPRFITFVCILSIYTVVIALLYSLVFGNV